MQKIKLWYLIIICGLITIISTVFTGCEKDSLDINANKFSNYSNSSTKTSINNKTNEEISGYDEQLLSEKENIKNILALAISEGLSNPEFRTFLWSSLFDQETKKPKELFLVELINCNENSIFNSVIMNSAQGEHLEQLVTTIENNYPYMVIKAADFVQGFMVQPSMRSVSPEHLALSVPLGIYPETSQPTSESEWLGYGFDPGTNTPVVHTIHSDGFYNDHIPVFVKDSEKSILVKSNESLNDDRNIAETIFGSNLPEEVQTCIQEYIVNNSSTLCGSIENFSTVVLLDLVNYVYGNCYPLAWDPVGFEICDNGIDDDDDGLIDEDDPDCAVIVEEEICDNGIDDDGDGLVDFQDPDCDPELYGCLICDRDCETDRNRMFGMEFNSVDTYDLITGNRLPHEEDGCTLEFHWTRLFNESNCASDCPNTRGDQSVSRTLIRVEIPDEYHPSQDDFWLKDDSDATGLNNLVWNQFIDATDAAFLAKGSKINDIPPGKKILGKLIIRRDVSFWWWDDDIELVVYLDRPLFMSWGYRYLTNDWSGDIIGNLVMASVAEVDGSVVTVGNQTSQTSQKQHSFSVNIGKKILKSSDSDKNDPNAISFAYGLNSSQTKQTSRQVSFRHKDVVDLGEIFHEYCDAENFNSSGLSLYKNESNSQLTFIEDIK